MAIDAGTVYYTVDANTQKAIDAATDMKTSLEDMQKSMAKTDMQAKQYAKSLSEAGSSVSKAGVVLDKFGNVNSEATAKMQKLMAMSDALNQKHIELSKTATGVRRGIAGMGQNAGQAGIQFQQFIGQIQGGQSAMLALSQQSADLGFVLGAPLLGAVVGIGASIAGMLLPNLFKTTDALEDVEKATERVRAAITLSSEGVTGYSDKMKVLSQVSESLARIQLANIIADQANAMKVALNGVGEEFDNAFDKPWSTYESNVRDLFGEASFSAFEAAAALKSASGALSSGVDEQKINDLAEALQKAKNAGIQTTESGRQLTSTMANLIAEYKLGELTISQLKEQLDGTKLSFDDVAESATKYDNLLKRLTIRSNETKTAQLEQEKALVMLEKGYQELEPEKQKAIADAYDLVIANTKETESERALARAKRETAAAERESQKASKAFIQNFGVEGDDFADPNDPDSVATSYSRDITDTYNPETKLEQLQRERDMVLMFQEMERGDAEAHAEALIAIDKQIAEERMNSNDLIMTSLDALGSAGTNAISGILSGTMSASDAMRNLANSILNNAVGALMEMGIQYVKNQIIEKTAAASSVATAAVTGPAIASAYAPAAAAASVATLGGAATAGLAAMAASIPAMIGMVGMAHDGIGEVPTEGTWLLNKGERVYTNDSAKQLDQMYSRVMKPAYPSAATSGGIQSDNQSSSSVNLKVDIVNKIDGAQYKTQMTEEGVRIIATQVFNDNIDKGVSGVLGKKGTKANKTMTSKYDTRNKY